jgi:solute carrier family 27 fatty acid transporter 1/4
MENKPEYVCIWLGLSKIGVVSGFINTNLRSDALVSSINTVKASIVIYSSALEEG